MTTLIRGELIKATTTRTIFAYGAMAVALAVAQVLVVDPAGVGRPDVAGRQDRRRSPGCRCWSCCSGSSAPPANTGTGRPRRPRSSPAATRGSAAARARGRLRRGGRRGRRAGHDGDAGGRPAAAGRSARPGRWAQATSRSSPAGRLVAAALSAVFGVALGALVRNQVVAVTGTLIVIFVVLPLSNTN